MTVEGKIVEIVLFEGVVKEIGAFRNILVVFCGVRGNLYVDVRRLLLELLHVLK